MGNLTPELERKLGMAVERMPAFPKSVQKILELTRNINCLPKELVAVIEKDPVMTLKILRVVNSAFYGLPNKVTSVNQAVVYLGINTLKNLALSFAAVGILPGFNAAGFDTQRYLVHSLTTGVLARQLCQKYSQGQADPGDCYIAGLLHDFGKVVFALFLAPEFSHAMALTEEKGIPLHEAELEVIGVEHGYVGAMLAAKWQFAEPLVECIRLHHMKDAEPTAMLDCLRMADQIARQRGQFISGTPYRDDEAPIAPERFGADLATVVASLGDLDKIVAEAMAFVEVQ